MSKVFVYYIGDADPEDPAIFNGLSFNCGELMIGLDDDIRPTTLLIAMCLLSDFMKYSIHKVRIIDVE